MNIGSEWQRQMMLRRGKAKENRACDNCRRRKIRCHTKDHETGCQFCTRMRFTCTYNDPILKRGPKSSLVSRLVRERNQLHHQQLNHAKFKLPHHHHHHHPMRHQHHQPYPNDHHNQHPLHILHELLTYRAHRFQLAPQAVAAIVHTYSTLPPTSSNAYSSSAAPVHHATSRSLLPLDQLIALLQLNDPPFMLSLLLQSTLCYYYAKVQPDPVSLDQKLTQAVAAVRANTTWEHQLFHTTKSLLDQLAPPHRHHLPPPSGTAGDAAPLSNHPLHKFVKCTTLGSNNNSSDVVIGSSGGGDPSMMSFDRDSQRLPPLMSVRHHHHHGTAMNSPEVDGEVTGAHPLPPPPPQNHLKLPSIHSLIPPSPITPSNMATATFIN